MTAALLLSAVLWGQLPAQVPSAPVRLSASDFAKAPHRVDIWSHWRFQAGDEPSWAQPEVDDSSWLELESLLRDGNAPVSDARVGWFRLRLELDPELVGKPMALGFMRAGAMQAYVDGHLVMSLGSIEDTLQGHEATVDLLGEFATVTFHRANPVIAVRFSLTQVQAASRTGFPGGFAGSLGPDVPARASREAEIHSVTRLYYFFIGLAVALAGFHLLLFIFLRDQKAHLVYGLSTLSVASLSVFVILRMLPMPLTPWLWCGLGFSVSLLALSVFGLRFIRQVTHLPWNSAEKVYQAIGVLLLLVVWWLPMWVAYLYSSLALLEQARVVIVANCRRMQDMWIIAIGLLCAVVMSLVQMLPEMLGLDESWMDNAYIYGFMASLLSMSIYLARSFARTHRDLEHRLVEVRMLSESTLEQERRVKSEEMLRVRLEEENRRQGLELEEARKRQEVMEQLQRAHDELHETQAQLVQSEKMASLGQLVAGIAHEINTPIGAIHSIHDSLSRAITKIKGILEEEAPQLLEDHRKLSAMLKVLDDAAMVIESGSTRVARIVQRLKTFARLDEAELQEADLQEGLQDTLLLLHHELKHNITVHTDYGEIPPISCYPGQLNQVFLNLLVNARQAIDGHGEIFVRTQRVEDKVHVSIRDTGVGIPQENLRKVFDPGFTTKGVKVGTGLGLSICYRIMQEHHGELRVESEVGVGTTFTMVLPIELKAPQP